MEEDLEFNRFIRDALESKGEFRVARKAWRTHFSCRWSVPALLAAAFALVAILQTTFAPRADRVSDAIRLLSLAEELEVDGSSPADLLLAWQDAPCQEVL